MSTLSFHPRYLLHLIHVAIEGTPLLPCHGSRIASVHLSTGRDMYIKGKDWTQIAIRSSPPLF